MKSRFFSYFPPPRYLRMPAYGVDLSDRSLKFLLLEPRHSSLTVARYGERLLPEGVIRGGEIQNKAALVTFLRAVRAELRHPHILAALPEEKAFLVAMHLPGMAPEAIRGAVELQLEEYVPLKPEEIIFDLEASAAPGETLDVNVTAYPSAFVSSYRDVFVEADFVPLAFEMEMHAIVRAVVPQTESGRPLMVVDFGKTRTTLAIVEVGRPVYAATVGIAGKDLTLAVQKSAEVDEFEAETMKRERGFVKSKENEVIFQALLPALSSVKDEIYKHLSYWESHLESQKEKKGSLGKLLLVGGESNIRGLAEYLGYELKLPVVLANPWVNVVSFEEHIPEIDLQSSLAYGTAVGLAIRGANVSYD